MAEIIAVTATFILLFLLLKGLRKSGTASGEMESTPEKYNSEGIVGKSTFVLTAGESSVSEHSSSGKMDIELPLEYEPDISSIEEQEELEELGLPLESSANISFEEMMEVVNDVESVQPKNPAKAGKLLYENDNTYWVGQIASSSPDYQKRIVELIDLHLGKLGQNKIKQIPSNDLDGFDIWEYC